MEHEQQIHSATERELVNINIGTWQTSCTINIIVIKGTIFIALLMFNEENKIINRFRVCYRKINGSIQSKHIFYHLFSYSSGSILYHCVKLCILIVMPSQLRLCIINIVYVPFWVLSFIVLFCVLFVCNCVLYYCHRVSTQLQLTNTSI